MLSSAHTSSDDLFVRLKMSNVHCAEMKVPTVAELLDLLVTCILSLAQYAASPSYISLRSARDSHARRERQREVITLPLLPVVRDEHRICSVVPKRNMQLTKIRKLLSMCGRGRERSEVDCS